ncbi:hypothetical protein [Prosthecochloris aestuarii]|uniref:hypothetical protein n=1 Tax=Prosthecochloris aestuarii TaxID=1102 RepID=UPI001427A825|nr:hypothetical protein [Prosthecochloris aestuarii]
MTLNDVLAKSNISQDTMVRFDDTNYGDYSCGKKRQAATEEEKACSSVPEIDDIRVPWSG